MEQTKSIVCVISVVGKLKDEAKNGLIDKLNLCKKCTGCETNRGIRELLQKVPELNLQSKIRDLK